MESIPLFDDGTSRVVTSRTWDPSVAADVIVYTDGACSGNPGPGAWAWVAPHGEYDAGYDPATTNQRMELLAAHNAVLAYPDDRVHIVTDSRYIVDCFEQKWYVKWLKYNFRRSSRPDSKLVKHSDLWATLIAEYQTGRVSFEWVRGHNGDRWNEKADALAVKTLQHQGLTWV